MADAASTSGSTQDDRETDNSGKQQAAKRRKARKSVLKRLTKIVGKDGLYHSVMLVLVDDVGTVQTYSNSPGWRTYLSCEDNIRRLLSKRKPKLSHQQRLAKVSVYGEPPTPQHAFDVLNANACENLLRVMEFSKLKGQDIPMHMQALQGAYIHLGKYLDEDGRGKVDGNKFEGHDKKNGRFKAQLFKEHELCKLDAWVSGECPEGPEYVTFEDLLQTSIAKMTKPMKVAAIFVMLEWANPGARTCYAHTCIHLCARECCGIYETLCVHVCMYAF
jgi:hypothetical protein